MIKVLGGLFFNIRDFRVKGMVLYPIREVLFCSLVGTLAGAEDFEEIVLFCNEKIEFLKTFLKFEHIIMKRGSCFCGDILSCFSCN